jgi:predicted TIM-barrel fold metal-dependent hydrolase
VKIKEMALLVDDYRPAAFLVKEDHIPKKAKFPVVDSHNHLFGDVEPEEMVRVMDKTGIRVFVNLTGNSKFTFIETGYSASPRDIDYFFDNYVRKFPDRFICFTTSLFGDTAEEILIRDGNFTENAVRRLEEDVKKGARGLKILKELGLKFKDSTGKILRIDDERLFPLWERAGELGVPVLIHTSDPVGFFRPVDMFNEHYPTLVTAPEWSFYGSYYSKEQLLEQRNRMISLHPETTFICPHVANYAENLGYVSEFLDSNKNVYIDFSARIDELGRQPYTAREFLIKHQDRVLFGTDMPLRQDIYSAYFRFLETRDEYFDYPDYVGRHGFSRWGIYGLYLPDPVLEKIYWKNACKVISGLKI